MAFGLRPCRQTTADPSHVRSDLRYRMLAQRDLLTSGVICRFQLLTQRKPNVTQEWKEKLPDFVKRLEEALYQGAASKVSSETAYLSSMYTKECSPRLLSRRRST